MRGRKPEDDKIFSKKNAILCIFSQKEGHFRPSYYKLALFLWIYIPIDTLCFILERPRECGVPEKAELFGVLLIGAQVVYVVVL